MARNTGHSVRTGLNVVGTIYIDIQLFFRYFAMPLEYGTKNVIN